MKFKTQSKQHGDQPDSTTVKTADGEQTEDPLESLRSASLSLRPDLQISRLIFQGQPSYIVHDPVSFQNQRLSLADYAIVTHLRADRDLGQCFDLLVAKGRLQLEDETAFYQFIIKLQRLGILSLPFSNGKVLFQQHEDMAAFRSRGGLLKFFFMTVPLANPDAFLSRTIPLFRWLFTRTFMIIWLTFGLAALGIIAVRMDQFLQPFNALLATQNVVFMSAAFLALKVWHELGHGYACKVFGGRIPEMGMMLMAGMPLAYVDASAAWNFSRRRHRLLVMLGGMYFESLIAIPAVFVWALVGDCFVGSCAYQLIFMAGVTTLFFNANPLMRYDGYFVLSELLGIPNLRSRATTEVINTAKVLFLGLDTPTKSAWGLKATLLIYGILASLFRATVVLGIATMLSAKLLLIGVALVALHFSKAVWDLLSSLLKYLLISEETNPVRRRASVCAGVVVLGIPSCLAFVPVMGDVTVTGVVTAENEFVVRADQAGLVSNVFAESGRQINAATPLLRLENREIEHQEAIARASLKQAILQHQVANGTAPPKAALDQLVRPQNLELLDARARLKSLTVDSPDSDRPSFVVSHSQRGAFLQAGDIVATVLNGRTLVRVWLDEEMLQATALQNGDEVDCRFSGNAGSDFVGHVLSIAPAPVRNINDVALTNLGGGNIIVHPITGQSLKPLYRVEILVPEYKSEQLLHESLSRVRLPRRREPVGYWLTRKCKQFINKLLIG